LLADYDRTNTLLDFSDAPGLHHEIITRPHKPAGLRVAARGEQPVSYTFQVTSRSATSGEQVQVFESRSLRGVSFPF
jgi:hypothetical protein